MENDELIQDLEVQRRRTGIMYIDGEPLYIMEHVMSEIEDNDYVACFDVDTELYEKSKGQVINKQRVAVQPKTYSNSSILGRSANKLRDQLGKRSTKFTYKPAVYIAKVEKGKGFIQDEVGMGFYEYTPDKVDLISGKLIRGDRTGVFVLMDYIDWGEPKLDMKALERSIQLRGGDWHDL